MGSAQTYYDIILIVPNYKASRGVIWKSIAYRFHAPGILSLASYIKSKRKTVSVLDCNLENIDEQDFFSEFQKRYCNASYKFVGFTGSTQTMNQAYRLSKKLKEIKPEVKIIFGGAHATALPEDVLKNDHIDIAVIGEGELTLYEIISGKSIAEIHGIAYRTINGIKTNPSRERIKNLDDLPMNDYSLVPVFKSKPLVGTYRRLPATIMVTSRGCPGACTFCSRVLGHELNFMSPARIVEEMKILYHKYNFRQIIFYDDTFVANKTRIEEFCELLIKSDMKISWTCSSRVDKVYPDTLKKMKQAGCHQIMFGIESFDESVLKNINKKVSKADIYYAINETQKAGIEARAAIMIGNPGDTENILKNNIKELIKLKPDIIQATLTTPLPGSRMFADAMKKNKIITYDWDKYDGKDCLFPHETLSFGIMLKYYKKTYLRFYLRPHFIVKQLFNIQSALRINVLFSGLISLFSLLFTKTASGEKRN